MSQENELLFVIEAGRYKGFIEKTISDGIHVDRTNGLTVDEYSQQQGKKFIAVTFNELENIVEDYHSSKVISEPEEIDHNTFIEMLEVLPPCRWGRVGKVEMFHMMERITDDLASWYAKVDGRYYSFIDSVQADAIQLEEKVMEAAEI